MVILQLDQDAVHSLHCTHNCFLSEWCRKWIAARAICQRGLSEQKLIYAPFCIKGETAHTSLYQIGPNLASHYADLISYQSMCSDLDKPPITCFGGLPGQIEYMAAQNVHSRRNRLGVGAVPGTCQAQLF